jgi:hypothetical protein
MKTVTIRGRGISACVCASVLLKNKNLKQIFLPQALPKNNSPRYILINPLSYSILKDFIPDIGVYLHKHGTLIKKHYIFSEGKAVNSLPFSHTWIIELNGLTDFFFNFVSKEERIFQRENPQSSSYTINCSGKSVSNRNRQRFGKRQLIHLQAELTEDVQNESFFELTTEGWFYLAPIGNQKGIVQIIIPRKAENLMETALQMLEKAKKIKSLVKKIEFSTDCIPVSPSFCNEKTTNEFLTGDALISYDPVSGYGLLNAMRSSILCSAVTNKWLKEKKSSAEDYNYYLSRNLKGLQDHLAGCISLYSQFKTSLWEEEINEMEKGLQFLNRQAADLKIAAEMRLAGFELKKG